MTELKPCPFCGEEAYYNHGEPYYGRLWWHVECSGCGVAIHDRRKWDENRPGMLDPAYPPKECFDRWNARVDEKS